jgi:hypothetical protein
MVFLKKIKKQTLTFVLDIVVGKKIVTCSQILSRWQICGRPIFPTWYFWQYKSNVCTQKNWLKSPKFKTKS